MSLPSIKEIYSESLEESRKQNELSVLLNQPPKETWIKEHPLFKKVKYMPIARIEYLLSALFIKWRVEIKNVQLIGNSIVVHVRLHYMEPLSKEWDWQEGVGAAPIQTKQGAGAADWNSINTYSVMQATPAAESFAVKDAAHKIGKMFGKDLNREDEILYDSLLGKFNNNEDKFKKLMEALRNYKGDDRDSISEMCREKKKLGELTDNFIDNVLKQIS